MLPNMATQTVSLMAIPADRTSATPNPNTGAADAYWTAVSNRDATFDGIIYYAVRSTGVYCQPSCPSR